MLLVEAPMLIDLPIGKECLEPSVSYHHPLGEPGTDEPSRAAKPDKARNMGSLDFKTCIRLVS